MLYFIRIQNPPDETKSMEQQLPVALLETLLHSSDEEKRTSYPSAVQDVFTFTADRMRRYQGAWHLEQINPFPGCIFIQCGEPETENRNASERNEHTVRNSTRTASLMRNSFMEKKMTALLNRPELQHCRLEYGVLPAETAALLQELGGPAHHLSMSRGVIQNGRTQVTEGPLRGRESCITRIDRHKRFASLSLHTRRSEGLRKEQHQNAAADEPVVLRVGLEITEKTGEYHRGNQEKTSKIKNSGGLI